MMMKKDEIKVTIKRRLVEAIESTPKAVGPPLFNRIQFEIPPLDPLSWLKSQSAPIKTYGSERRRHYEVAGIGAIDILTDDGVSDFSNIFPIIRKRIAASHQQIKYFGGIAFDSDQSLDNDWASFGKYYFLVPRFEIFSKNGQTFFAGNYRSVEGNNGKGPLPALLQELDDITFLDSPDSAFIPNIEKRKDLAAKPDWKRNVREAVRLIETTALNKVVLSRKTTLKLSQTPDPFDLMEQLKKISTGSFDFCFQPAQNTAFLGSTPELLYRRIGRTIDSEAIAGTRPRGANEQEDRVFFDDLANSHKDKQEYQVVVDSVLATLNSLCNHVDILKQAEILKLTLVQHLYSQFRGELKAGITDEDILMALHPTPSVLGEPKPRAFQDLAKLEPYYRGWYAGPLGWIGADEATFIVGIRSGLLNDGEISLFSGAGIVSESDPDEEWDEIENKIGQFLKVFQPQVESVEVTHTTKQPKAKQRRQSETVSVLSRREEACCNNAPQI